VISYVVREQSEAADANKISQESTACTATAAMAAACPPRSVRIGSTYVIEQAEKPESSAQADLAEEAEQGARKVDRRLSRAGTQDEEWWQDESISEEQKKAALQLARKLKHKRRDRRPKKGASKRDRSAGICCG